MMKEKRARYERALLFAQKAHEGQMRKYHVPARPYIVHPVAVAKLVIGTKGHTMEMVEAALLHDVLEDTDVTAESLSSEFGWEVRDLVEWLTNPPKREGEVRKDKKVADAERLAVAPIAVKTIKLADRIDNLSSVLLHDPKFGKVYREESKGLLEALRGGDSGLWGILADLVA